MSAIIFAARALGPFAANCYIVGCPRTKEAAVIDPGQPHPWIQATVDELGLTVRNIWLTHAHLDHIGGVAATREWSGAPVSIHPEEADWLQDPAKNGSLNFGPIIVTPPADALFQAGETLRLGDLRVEVRHTPGHSPGSVSFYFPDQGFVICGDTLFAGGIGRCDLVGGSLDVLLRSIAQQLLTLPKDTVVYPGHGGATTVADETEYNPFLSQG